MPLTRAPRPTSGVRQPFAATAVQSRGHCDPHLPEQELRQLHPAPNTLGEHSPRAALRAADIQSPATQPPGPAPYSELNKPLQAAMSVFIRRTRMPFKQFVELVHCQRPEDYRPNKALLPNVLRAYCRDYEHVDDLTRIASEGTRVHLTSPLPSQEDFPSNHPSVTQHINSMYANIRKEQNTFRCFVIDADIKILWPELFISPLGVVDKGTGDPLHLGSQSRSVISRRRVCQLQHRPNRHLFGLVRALRQHHPRSPPMPRLNTNSRHQMHGNAGIHSDSVHLFPGYTPEDNAIVIDLAAAFGWTGSLGTYEVLGGAVAHIHGACTNSAHAAGFYN
jgi:hypothetical protein